MSNILERDGALPVESCQAERVPGPLPRRGQPQATGGRRPLFCGVKEQSDGKPTIDQRALHIIRWNAEGVLNKKKAPLTKRLYEEYVDVVCLQETHLNSNHYSQLQSPYPKKIKIMFTLWERKLPTPSQNTLLMQKLS
jgi:hypothetical protein